VERLRSKDIGRFLVKIIGDWGLGIAAQALGTGDFGDFGDLGNIQVLWFVKNKIGNLYLVP
jgi:hypothetical protein